MRPGHLPALPSQSALSRFCSPLRRAVRERQEPGARAGQGGQARCGELLCFPYLALSICVPRAARLTRGLGVTLGGAMKMPDTGGGDVWQESQPGTRGQLSSGSAVRPRGWALPKNPRRMARQGPALSPISGANSTLLDPTGEGVVPGSGWSFGDRVFTSNTGPPAPFSVHLLGSGGRASGHWQRTWTGVLCTSTVGHGREDAARLRPRPVGGGV